MTSDDAALPADGADVGAEVSDPDGRPVRIRFSIPAGKGLPGRIVTIAMSAAEAARVAILLSLVARAVLVHTDPTLQETAWITIDAKFDVTNEPALIAWALERHAKAVNTLEGAPGRAGGVPPGERERILDPVHGAGEALRSYFHDAFRLLPDLPPGVEVVGWSADAMTPEPHAPGP